jgi:hypothetical protein
MTKHATVTSEYRRRAREYMERTLILDAMTCENGGHLWNFRLGSCLLSFHEGITSIIEPEA